MGLDIQIFWSLCSHHFSSMDAGRIGELGILQEFGWMLQN